jgi:hypothetical protein
MYDAYRAAGSPAHEDKPIMSKLHREEAYVSSAVGGSLSQISFEGSAVRTRVATIHGGGIRGKIKGFSEASRRNFLKRFASINRISFRAYEGRVFSIVLTYPHEWPEHNGACKGHLKALYKRLKRMYGDFAGYWRLGIQRRGAWHFHLLLFVSPSFGSVGELRDFVASAWCEICGELSEEHLLTGTHVREIRKWRSATSYMEKYAAKSERFPEGVETGRVWGTWNRELLPVRWETVKVSLSDAYKIRRIYRRLAKMGGRGHLCRLTVFVRHENVVRLLEFLGYRQEE